MGKIIISCKLREKMKKLLNNNILQACIVIFFMALAAYFVISGILRLDEKVLVYAKSQVAEQVAEQESQQLAIKYKEQNDWHIFDKALYDFPVAYIIFDEKLNIKFISKNSETVIHSHSDISVNKHIENYYSVDSDIINRLGISERVPVDISTLNSEHFDKDGIITVHVMKIIKNGVVYTALEMQKEG